MTRTKSNISENSKWKFFKKRMKVISTDLRKLCKKAFKNRFAVEKRKNDTLLFGWSEFKILPKYYFYARNIRGSLFGKSVRTNDQRQDNGVELKGKSRRKDKIYVSTHDSIFYYGASLCFGRTKTALRGKKSRRSTQKITRKIQI